MLCEYCNKEIKENQSRTMLSNDYNLEVNKSYHHCCFHKMKEEEMNKKDYKKLYEELKILCFGNGSECPQSIFGAGYKTIDKFKDKCKHNNCGSCFDESFIKWEGEILNNE